PGCASCRRAIPTRLAGPLRDPAHGYRLPAGRPRCLPCASTGVRNQPASAGRQDGEAGSPRAARADRLEDGGGGGRGSQAGHRPPARERAISRRAVREGGPQPARRIVASAENLVKAVCCWFGSWERRAVSEIQGLLGGGSLALLLRALDLFDPREGL